VSNVEHAVDQATGSGRASTTPTATGSGASLTAEHLCDEGFNTAASKATHSRTCTATQTTETAASHVLLYDTE